MLEKSRYQQPAEDHSTEMLHIFNGSNTLLYYTYIAAPKKADHARRANCNGQDGADEACSSLSAAVETDPATADGGYGALMVVSILMPKRAVSA